MTKVQITAFLTVAREKSFTRAANMLYISQPAISKSISTLEEELGFRLFDRKDNVLTLTNAGGLMYEFFVRVGDEYRLLLENIESTLENSSASVRIGCPDSWNPVFFYDRIKTHFALKHPDMRLSIECCKLSDLIIRLKGGKLDIVLTHDFYSPALYGISSEYLTTTGCGLLYSKAHFGENVQLEDFRDTNFLLYDNDIQKKFESVVREICQGLFVPVMKNSGQLANALFSVACGEGIMLFSDWDSIVTNTAYGYFPLKTKLPVRLIYTTENKEALVDMMIKEIPPLFKD